MSKFWRHALRSAPLLAGAAALGTAAAVSSQSPAATHLSIESDGAAPAKLLDAFCSRCHNDYDKAGGLSIEDLRSSDVAEGRNTDVWEKILRRTSLGEMPPRNKPQPDGAMLAGFEKWLEGSLDNYALAHPDPGRTTIRRLNRAEYANAVSDLLGVELDIAKDLPPDNSGYGFDNIADVLTTSPMLIDRYVAVAGRVSRLATGQASRQPFVTSFEVPKDGSILNQGRPSYNERASDELPLASRGGAAFKYYARFDATYEVGAYLNSNTNNETDRLREDRFGVRIPLKAGMHTIGVSFRKSLAPDETVQRLTNTTDVVVLPTAAPAQLPLDFSVDGVKVAKVDVPSYRMHPRFAQANWLRDVLQVDVTGPIDAQGAGNTPSRRRIFICQPTRGKEDTCARQILTNLAHLAYRRPVTASDVDPLMRLYASERQQGSFEQGIEAAVEAILVSPAFLFVVEQDPAGSRPGESHPVSDIDLATRLSLFLWSSIPDLELLTLAERGQLHLPEVLDAQVTRMLADRRAMGLTRNFAGQWLYLRNLDQQRPDIDAFPHFDTRLRQAMGTETELFFAYVLQQNRSILDFISADYTFLNQRLADHYGIPGVRGTAFRKVSLPADSPRGGLLGQAAILTVTSYANHTSVVKRGKWILENLLSSPPPPPPPDVPALKERQDGRLLSARAQIELHRANPNCAVCHVKMDPLGFALENFDAVGGFRTTDGTGLIDATAVMPDGTGFAGADGLRKWLMGHQDQFANAFTQRLLTYALGRGLEGTDQPTVRALTRDAKTDGYRIQAFVRGVVTSMPFTTRKTPGPRPLEKPAERIASR